MAASSPKHLSSCKLLCASGLTTWQGADDVRVAWVSDRQATNTVISAASSPQFSVVTVEMMHTRLREHGIILYLTLSQRWAIVSDQDQLGLALSQRLQGGRIP